jgi:hypothetical protein
MLSKNRNSKDEIDDARGTRRASQQHSGSHFNVFPQTVAIWVAMNINNTSVVCNDASLGPSARGCRDGFDFTFKFEQLFFSIVPSAIFLLATPLRLRYLCRFRPKVGGNSFKNLKLVRATSGFTLVEQLITFYHSLSSCFLLLYS